MSIIESVRAKLTKKKTPDYEVYIPNKQEIANNKLNVPSYSSDFIGPIQKNAVRVDNTAAGGPTNNDPNKPLVNSSKLRGASRGNSENYNQETESFQVSTQGQTSATSQTRYPTREELGKINLAKERGSLRGIGEGYARINKKVEDYLKTNNNSSSLAKRFYAGRTGGRGNQELPGIATKPFNEASELTLKAGEYAGEKIRELTEQGPGYTVVYTNPGSKGSAVFSFPQKDNTQSTTTKKINEIANIPSPITREQAKDIIKTAYTFTFFTPAIKTGTAQQSEYAEVQTTQGKRFIRKSDLQRYLNELELEGKTIKTPSSQTKIDRLNNLIRNLNPQNREEGLKKVLQLAREEYGESFVKDYMTQEGLIPIKQPITNPSLQSSNPFQTNIIGPRTTDMNQVGNVITAVRTPQSLYFGTGQYEKTDTTRIRTATSTNNGQGIRVVDVLGTKNGNLNKQEDKQITIVGPRVDTKQNNSSFNDNKQDTGQDQGNVPRDAFTPKPVQDMKPKQDIKPKTSIDFGIRTPRPTRPKITIPIRIPGTSGGNKGLIKRLAEQPGLFKVFGRRFGKDINLGSFGTKPQAEKKLKTFLTNTLGRSGFLTEGNKKVKTDLLGGMFTPSKKDPYRIVQKKEYSLNTQQERREINLFKKQKKGKNLFF